MGINNIEIVIAKHEEWIFSGCKKGRRADFSYKNMDEFCFDYKNLSGANFKRCSLRGASFINTNLSGAELSGADFSRADLTNTNLNGAYLNSAYIRKTILKNTNFRNAFIGYTTFSDLDLRFVNGLESLIQLAPSTIGIDTICRSKGEIPHEFLKGSGVPESLLPCFASSIQERVSYYSCFISCSHDDDAFAKRLHSDLLQQNIRCWFAPSDMKIGSEIRQTIDDFICNHDKLLVILSKNSIESDWVQNEVEAALDEEKRRGNNILFPIRLDESINTTDKAWVKAIQRRRNIGDFTQSDNSDFYRKAFRKLIKGLETE